MKLIDFGLPTDENIDEQIVLAMAENRVVVTHDSDFGTLAIAAG